MASAPSVSPSLSLILSRSLYIFLSSAGHQVMEVKKGSSQISCCIVEDLVLKDNSRYTISLMVALLESNFNNSESIFFLTGERLRR